MGLKFKKKNQKLNPKRKKGKGSSDSKGLISKPPSRPPPSKKSKPSNGDSRKSESKSEEESGMKNYFEEEAYIPLDVSGPTKFAVANLDEVKPYQKHDAISLKERLLFGSRVKRFSNSKLLEVYKLKRKAASKAT